MRNIGKNTIGKDTWGREMWQEIGCFFPMFQKHREEKCGIRLGKENEEKCGINIGKTIWEAKQGRKIARN